MKKTKLGAGINAIIEQAGTQEEQRISKEKEIEVTINFKIPKSLHTALKVYTVNHDTSIKDLITSLIEDKLQIR